MNLEFECYKVRLCESTLSCVSTVSNMDMLLQHVRRCGKDNCYGVECLEDKEQVKCLPCEVNRCAGSAKCPKRIKEGKVNGLEQKRVCYMLKLLKMERHNEMEAALKELEQERNGAHQHICINN